MPDIVKSLDLWVQPDVRSPLPSSPPIGFLFCAGDADGLASARHAHLKAAD